MKRQKTTANTPDKRTILISQALERRRLGLSPAEYSALTPAELECEMEASELRDKIDEMKLQIFDEHFARIELLLNGFRFPKWQSVDDFRILKRNDERQAKTSAKRGQTEMAYLINDKRRADEYIKRRDAIRAKRGK